MIFPFYFIEKIDKLLKCCNRQMRIANMYFSIAVAVDFFIEIFDYNVVRTISSLGKSFSGTIDN